MKFDCCAIIPSYNHWTVLPAVVDALLAQDLPVLIVDDGSDRPAAQAITALHAPERRITVIRRPVNGGKGAAVCDGLRAAWTLGFSHAVQIDADGQHDLAQLPAMLAAARARSDAIVSGVAVYDRSVPTGRKIGRWVTHLWVYVETMSLRISDSMCGFRVYPLAAVQELLAEESVGAHMDFDTEIMVRLFWRGVPPVMLPVRVIYPPGNLSNFDLLRDNWRITRMHTRLVFGMLARLPSILRHRPPPVARPGHWAVLQERGTLWGLSLVGHAYRLLGHRGILPLLLPIILYFHVTGRTQRAASRHYLRLVGGRDPSQLDLFRHSLDFAVRALDSFAAWAGAIPAGAMQIESADSLQRAAADRSGRLLVVSHHGNADLSRALMAPALRQRLTVLVHTRHAENYNRLLRELNPEAAGRTVQVTEIGPDTAIALRACIERGEWVAIAGDRIPVLSQGRVVRVPFLGQRAAFSQGPWVLASLLGCPVSLLFCWREGGRQWRLALEDFSGPVTLSRGSRAAEIGGLAARYAARLEAYCRRKPFQWYNFFDFWAETGER